MSTNLPYLGTISSIISLPAIVHRSGNRIWYTTSISLKSLGRFVKTSTTKNKSIVDSNIRNRFLNNTHKNDVKEYLREEKEFILPPITLVSPFKLNFKPFVPGENETPSLEELLDLHDSVAGVIFLPLDYSFECLDGNHRTVAIRELADEHPEILNKSNIFVTIAHETRIKKIRQDFVDINKNAKATSSSINTLFDTRNKVACITTDLIDNIDYLSERTELFSVNVPKNSSSLFTLNGLRKAVIEFAGFDSTSTNSDGKANSLLKDPSLYEKVYFNTEIFFDYLRHNQFIKQCLQRPFQTPKLRMECVLLSTAGLTIASRLASYIFQTHSGQRLEYYLSQVINFNWSRTNSIFMGNIIDSEDKIVANRDQVKKATDLIAQKISLI